MITHADKSQDNKNQSVSAAESLKKSSSESALQFVDNRPEALAQRKMQEMADHRPEAAAQLKMQELANNSTPVIQRVTVRKNKINDLSTLDRELRLVPGIQNMQANTLAPTDFNPTASATEIDSAIKGCNTFVYDNYDFDDVKNDIQTELAAQRTAKLPGVELDWTITEITESDVMSLYPNFYKALNDHTNYGSGNSQPGFANAHVDSSNKGEWKLQLDAMDGAGKGTNQRLWVKSADGTYPGQFKVTVTRYNPKEH